jgi:hypothetical protein
MSIQGKKEGFCRLIGTTLIFIGLVLSIPFNYFILNNSLLYLIFILIGIPPFLVSIFLKLEQDFIVKNSLKILFIIVTIDISLVITTVFFISFLMILFALIVSSNFLLVSCWHFSLSLYKKNKLIFIISGLGYCIINFFLWFADFVLNNLLVVILLPLSLALIGILLIIVAELSMKKKGLLNYI